MNRFLPHTRRRVLVLGAGCVACTALLAGVASAASNGPSTTGSPNSTPTAGGAANAPDAKGKLAQAVKEILQQVRGGATHGEVTVDTKKGAQTIGFERGAVSQASPTSFQVTELDGTTGSWLVGDKTKVRVRGQAKKAAADGASPTASATVTDGENVVVVGLKTDGTTTARVVVVLPKAGGKARATKHAPAPTSGQRPTSAQT
jgi:hypothetical protein